jgi:O-acetyl-ADP-ribose deacetylase (regulator of RNase III)
MSLLLLLHKGKGAMKRIETFLGNIATLTVDVIVNTANVRLMRGGGVCGAIHRVAGPQLHEACERLAGCATGDAKITSGFLLSAKFVIHAVGPEWFDDREDKEELLASCYRKSLTIATEHGLHSIAFPLISTGSYGCPPRIGAAIAVREVCDFLADNSQIQKVVFAVFDGQAIVEINKALDREYARR